MRMYKCRYKIKLMSIASSQFQLNQVVASFRIDRWLIDLLTLSFIQHPSSRDMASQGTYAQTRLGIEAQERNVERVRRVFHQVWTEFYANKPKINKDLTREQSVNIADTCIRGAQAAFHESLRTKYADYVDVVPKTLPSLGAGAGKLGPSVGVEYKSKGRATNTTIHPKHAARSGPIATCPPYSFCSKTNRLIKVWHGFEMPFVPQMDDARVRKYGSTYHTALWKKEGLDPDSMFSRPALPIHQLTQ